jgi:hypothetical protein
VQQVAPALDPDAEAFLLAASITDATITSAINNLVLSLKADSIWTKMTALYPFVGGTASTHKFNLKNPVDSDAAFRLTFVGSPTHDANGVAFNGTSQYANTHLIPNTNIGEPLALGFYTGSNVAKGTDQIDMGTRSNESPSRHSWISSGYRLDGTDKILSRNNSASVLLDGGTNANFSGFYSSSKIGTTAKLYKNSTEVDSKSDSEALPTTVISLGAFNNYVTFQFFSNRDHRFSYVSKGLTGVEITNLYTTVQAFQTALSRNV